MKKEYFTISPNSIAVFLLVSIAWYLGTKELIDTVSNFGSQWYWIVLASAYGLTLNVLFCHRICTHQLFKLDTNGITYKVLVFLLTVDLAWSPLTRMCLAHMNHHIYSDQGNKDNLNWRRYWYNICILSPISYIYTAPSVYPNEEKFFAQQKKKFADILDDTWTFFVEENRVVLTVLFWAVLYMIAPIILFKIVLMGRVLMSIFMAMSTIGGHTRLPFSYRNYDTPDTTYNNMILHCFGLGIFSSMLHNNHHGNSNALNYGKRWFEFDIGSYIIRMLRPFLEKIDK